MKLKSFALLALVATVGTVACTEDPTNEGAGEAFAIVTDRSEAVVNVGGARSIAAWVIDANNRRVAGELEASVAGPGVSLDSVIYVPQLAETRVFARGVTADAAGTDITLTGHDLQTTIKVIVQ